MAPGISQNQAPNVRKDSWEATSVDATVIELRSEESLADHVPKVEAAHSESLRPATQTPQYHDNKDAQYVLPNDSPEHVRLTEQAGHFAAMMNHRITHAPIEASQLTQLLDVGCGTGIVTNCMSERYPEAKCYGLDISTVPATHAQLPNVKFLKGDILTQKPIQWLDNANQPLLTQDEGLFDYIFSRLLVLGVSNWPLYLKNAFSLLKPGGWVEIQDLSCDYFDMNRNMLSDDWEWHQCIFDACDQKGLDLRCGTKAKDWMAAAGFQDIQEHHYQYVFGSNVHSSGEASAFAKFNEVNLPELLHHALQRLMEGKASQERIDQLRRDMKTYFSPDIGMYMPFVATVGRKPL